MASASRKGARKVAAAQGLTPVAGDADLTSCPNCYLYFDYSVKGNNNLVPRLLTCGHLVCSTCVGDLFCEGSLCCPTCCEIHSCESPSAFPAVPASPIPSPQGVRLPADTEDGPANNTLIPSPVSLSERPATSPSPTASPSPASTGNSQALFALSEDGGGAPGDRLASFLSSVPSAEDPGVAESGGGSDLEEEGGGLCCLVTDCGRARMASDYFCSLHMDKAKRVSWKAAKRMVQTMSKGLYSMSTVVQGEKLGQFLENEFPSMENLKPEILSERFRRQDTITLGEALFLIDKALDILKEEPNALDLRAPVKIVGDLHGQFFDLISMLDHCGAPGGGCSYLFLGDYVDRGEFSCEVLLYLLALKVANPNNVHLIRGNHECRSLTTHFGFKDECKAKYGLPVYYRFLRCFELMPLCAVVSNKCGRYFCTHGGISPGLTSLDQIAALDRRAEPEMEGLLCDLLWADPSDDPGVTNIDSLSDQELDGLLNSTFQFNRLRGCSVAFGYLAIRRFLDTNKLLCVVRAHAVQEDGYYRHFEKALRKREVPGSENPLPPVITVFSAPNYCDRYGNRAAVLELLRDELEPRVKHFECVDHPARLNGPDRSEVHLTALIESCPYMPTTFRDFVKLAGRMGPAQPLEDGGEASETSSVMGTSSGDAGCSECEQSVKGSAPSSPPTVRKDRSLTAHDLYELEAAHDRINELHPDYLNARIESCEDEGVSRLSTKGNTPSSVSSLVGSKTKITVSELRNRFDPAARERVAGGHPRPLPVDMGKPSNTVSEITSIFEHKARSDRRKGLKGMHERHPSGSGGIVQQLTASIESKAKAAAHSPATKGRSGQTSTKQKISVFEALTKRTRSDSVATKLGRVKDSALARRIWVDKVGMSSPSPLWRGGNSGGNSGFMREDRANKTKGNHSGIQHANGVGYGNSGGGSGRTSGGVGGVSPRRHSHTGDINDGRFPPPPPPGVMVGQAGVGARASGIANSRAPWRVSSAPSNDPPASANNNGYTGGAGEGQSSADAPWRRSTTEGYAADREQRLQGGRDTAKSRDASRIPRIDEALDAPNLGANNPGLSGSSWASPHQRDGQEKAEHGVPSPPTLVRRGTLEEECAFTHAEILGLKLLFALMDQRGIEYIDGTALEEYADEQDDYAQEREIEACIKAVDVDCDGKIGLMDFICFAARLKCYYEGGVGLQKTLNHAGPGAKRDMSMSRPGDSDSEDEEDDEPNDDVDVRHDDPDVAAGDIEEATATEADFEGRRDEEDEGVHLANGGRGHDCDDEPDEHGQYDDDRSGQDDQDDKVGDGDEDEDGADDHGGDHGDDDDPEGDHGLVEQNEKGFSGVGDDDVDDLFENQQEDLGKEHAENMDDADGVHREDLMEDTRQQGDEATEVSFEDDVPEADLGTATSDSEIIGETSESCEGAESEYPTRTSSDTEASCTVPSPFPSSLTSEMGEDPPNDSVGMVSVASVSKAISAAVKAATTPGVTTLKGGSEEGKRDSEGNPFPTE